jgi:7-carboxy-7-deazaguanine synthase
MSTEAKQNAPSADSVVVWEMYQSIQGESTWAGLPCIFIRLSGCPLRCTYCDTEYAFYGGERQTISDVLAAIKQWECPLVEVTGGEPLAQPGCVTLLRELVAEGYAVLIETSGAFDTSDVPPEVHVILDIKCPSSGEQERNVYKNLNQLKPNDEVKFVIGTREDFDFAREIVSQYSLTPKCRQVLFSPVFGEIEPKQIVDWMLEENLNDVRFQLQMHKFIWDPLKKGV